MKIYLYDSTVGDYHLLLHNGVSMGISQFSNPKLDIYPPTYKYKHPHRAHPSKTYLWGGEPEQQVNT